MKKKTSFMVVIVIASLSLFFAKESPGQTVTFPLTVTDGTGGSASLTIGVDPSATDGIDPGLGEAELPPVPPVGIFDARLVGDDIGIVGLGQGVLKDFRNIPSQSQPFIKTHELKYQVGTGSTITVSWTRPLPTEIQSARLQDIVTGSIIDINMNSQSNIVVTNPSGINKVKITITYLLTPSPTKPTVVTTAATNVTSSSAQLNGTVNPNGASTTYYFQYGITTSYGSTSSTGDAGSGTSVVPVNRPISSLNANIAYHYSRGSR